MSSARKVRRVFALELGLAPPGYEAECLNDDEQELLKAGRMSLRGLIAAGLGDEHDQMLREAFEPPKYTEEGMNVDRLSSAVAVIIGNLPESFMPSELSEEERSVVDRMTEAVRARQRERQEKTEQMARKFAQALDDVVRALSKDRIAVDKCENCEQRDNCELLRQYYEESEALPTRGNC